MLTDVHWSTYDGEVNTEQWHGILGNIDKVEAWQGWGMARLRARAIKLPRRRSKPRREANRDEGLRCLVWFCHQWPGHIGRRPLGTYQLNQLHSIPAASIPLCNCYPSLKVDVSNRAGWNPRATNHTTAGGWAAPFQNRLKIANTFCTMVDQCKSISTPYSPPEACLVSLYPL